METARIWTSGGAPIGPPAHVGRAPARVTSGLARRALATLPLALSLLAAPASAEGPVVKVGIDNFTFGPAEITVAPGTTVTWVNNDDIPHTVVATDKSFRSKPLDTEDSYSFTFMKVGEYKYFCSLHPHMTGKVIVKPQTSPVAADRP